jgi:hypothetical protein
VSPCPCHCDRLLLHGQLRASGNLRPPRLLVLSRCHEDAAACTLCEPDWHRHEASLARSEVSKSMVVVPCVECLCFRRVVCGMSNFGCGSRAVTVVSVRLLVEKIVCGTVCCAGQNASKNKNCILVLFCMPDAPLAAPPPQRSQIPALLAEVWCHQ